MSDIALSSSTGEFKNYTQMAFLHGYSKVDKDPLLIGLPDDVREKMNSDILCPCCRIPGRIRRGSQQEMGSRQPAFYYVAENHLEHCFMTDLFNHDGSIKERIKYSTSHSDNHIFNSLGGHFISSCKSEGLFHHESIASYSSWVSKSLIKARMELPDDILSDKRLTSRMKKEAKKGFIYDTSGMIQELKKSLIITKKIVNIFYQQLHDKYGFYKEINRLCATYKILDKYELPYILHHLNKDKFDIVLKNILPIACFIGYLSKWDEAEAHKMLDRSLIAFRIKYSDKDESVTIPTPFGHICRRYQLLKVIN